MSERLTEDFLNELLATDNVDEFIDRKDGFTNETLSEYLNRMLIKRNLKKSTVINKSSLNNTFAYQIFSGERNPSRDKLLHLTFAMGLNLRETQRTLKLSGASELYCKNKRDAIIIYSINKNLDFNAMEELLYSFGENTVCAAT